MKMLYDILPVFLFFLAFKFGGMYVATIVGIVTTIIQVTTQRITQKRWDMVQVITLFVFLTLGGMTLYFHNPIFVKWKPTVIFWIFAVLMLLSQYFTKTPAIQRLMQNTTADTASIPAIVWGRLNLMWVVFFVSLGGLNLYIAYHYSSNTWVNFKFYGVTGAMLIFSILQAIYLGKYLIQAEMTKARSAKEESLT